MKVSNHAEAWEAYTIVERILRAAKKQYQLRASSGETIHEYLNLSGMAYGYLQGLKKRIDTAADMNEVQLYVDLATSKAYELAKYIGKNIV